MKPEQQTQSVRVVPLTSQWHQSMMSERQTHRTTVAGVTEINTYGTYLHNTSCDRSHSKLATYGRNYYCDLWSHLLWKPPPDVRPSVCLSVRQSVTPHVSHFSPAHISATVAPIHAKFCTHTPCLPNSNLHPSIHTWPSSSATMRPILAKHIFGHCSYNFCPKITQIGTQYVYSHLFNMDLSHIAPPSGWFCKTHFWTQLLQILP